MHFHKFTNWTQPFNSRQKRDNGSFGNFTMIPVTVQERTCPACGLVQARMIREGSVEDQQKGGNNGK